VSKKLEKEFQAYNQKQPQRKVTNRLTLELQTEQEGLPKLSNMDGDKK